jgi:hypothetical protein
MTRKSQTYIIIGTAYRNTSGRGVFREITMPSRETARIMSSGTFADALERAEKALRAAKSSRAYDK